MSPSAVDLRKAGLAAHALLLIRATIDYGLMGGGPSINVERCEEIAELAGREGFEYSHEEIQEAAVGMVAAINAEASA